MGFAGVILACAVTLRLLADRGIAGTAGSGFWALVLAAWLAASLVVTGMAALKPRDETLRRANDLAIPLLFGGFLFYLWEVTVRGFGVPSVLVPSPSATAVRFAASLPTLGRGFPADLRARRAHRLRNRLRRRFRGGDHRPPLHLSRPRSASDRKFRLRAADRRHRPDHGDVVRLRLAVEDRRRRGDHVLSDAGQHAGRPRRRRPYRARPHALLRRLAHPDADEAAVCRRRCRSSSMRSRSIRPWR